MSGQALMLHTRSRYGVGVADNPPQLFRYGLAGHDRLARTFVPFIETLQPDAVAWEALFTDEQRLATFKTIHGNRKGPLPRRRTPPAPTLFDQETAA